MITYEKIVAQIAKLAIQANDTKNEQHVREQLTAIRALCDVVLNDDSVQSNQSRTLNTESNFVNQSIPSPVFTQPVMPSSQKLEEADANGDSIFDF